MNLNNKNYISPLRLILISSIFVIATVVLPPLFFVFFSYFVGLYVAESVKMGIIRTMSIFAVLCVIIGATFNTNVGLLFFTLLAPIILGFHYCITSKYSMETTIAVTSALFFISIIVLIYSYGANNISDNSDEYLQQLIEIQTQMLSTSGASEAVISRAKISITSMYNMTIQLIPGMMVISSLIVSYWSFMIASNRLLREGIIIEAPGRFIYFRLPDRLFTSILFIGIVVFVAGSYLGDLRNILINNLFLLFFTLFFIQGVAILHYFAMRGGIPRFIRIIFTVIALVAPGFQMILAMVGAVDNLLDFRKIKKT